MNFVERKFLREQNLIDSTDVWNSACRAIHDAVNSYNEKFPDEGEAIPSSIGGESLLVEIEHKPILLGMDMKRRVTIALERNPLAISVAIDAAGAKKFPIMANENHCFLTSHGKNEISPEDFAERALGEALFTKRKLPSPTIPHRPAVSQRS